MNFKCLSMVFPTSTIRIGRSIPNTKETIIKITRSSSGFGKLSRLMIRINSLICSNSVLDLQELPSMVSSTTYFIQKIVKQPWKLLKIPHRIILVQQTESLSKRSHLFQSSVTSKIPLKRDAEVVHERNSE